MRRKILAASIVAALILSLSPFMLGATVSAGEKHWADGSIAACDEMGVLEGLAKSAYTPDEKATRGDMFKMMDNIMNYPDAATDKSFSDLDASHPHYKTLMKLAAAGIANGYDDGTMRPDAPVTREEAMVIFARAFGVDENSSAAYSFADSGAIAEWAQPLVGGMRQRSFIAGYLDGSFGPKLNVSMGELAKMIDNMLAGVINRAGTYTTDFGYGCAVVNVTGVTLNDLTVEGDLIAAAGIGKGDLILDSVTVLGRLIVNGGGVNSIIIRGNSNVGTIVVDNSAGGVSIKVQGDTNVEIVYVDDGSDEVFIEGEIGALAIGGDVDVTLRSGASVGDVTMNGEDSTLTISSGASAGNLAITGDDNSVVVAGTLESGMVSGSNNAITGTGKITDSVVYTGGEGNEITVVGTKVEVEEGAGDVKAGNETLTGGDDTTIPGSTPPSTGDNGYAPPPPPTAAQTFSASLNSTYGAGTATANGSTVRLLGSVALSDNLTIPGGVTLNIDAGKMLTVAAGKTLTISDGAILTVNGTLTVSGTVKNGGGVSIDDAFGLVVAMGKDTYSVVGTGNDSGILVYLTSVADVATDRSEYLYGGNFTIPSGENAWAVESTSNLTGGMKNAGYIVNGSLLYINEHTNPNPANYTIFVIPDNPTVALALAVRLNSTYGVGTATYSAPATVTLTNGATLSEDLTIPSGATLVVPSGKTLTVEAAATLKISGTLLVDSGTLTITGTVTNGADTEITAAIAILSVPSFSKTAYSVVGTNNATGILVYLTAIHDEDARNDRTEYLYSGTLTIESNKSVWEIKVGHQDGGVRTDGFNESGLFYVNGHDADDQTDYTVYKIS